MKKRLLLLSLLMHCYILSVPKIERVTLNSIIDIKPYITPTTLVVLDIDDTMIYDMEYSWGMTLIEPKVLPSLFNIIKKNSWGIISITARSTNPEYQKFTSNQINYYNFSFTPFFKNPHDTTCILANSDHKAFYQNGIISVEGTNKGKALSTFLSYLSTTPEAILFIDDRPYNLDHVYEVFKNNNNFPKLKNITLCDYPYVKNHLKSGTININ